MEKKVCFKDVMRITFFLSYRLIYYIKLNSKLIVNKEP